MSIHYTNEPTQRFVKIKYDGQHYVGEGETQTLAQVLGFRNKAVFECLALHQNDQCKTDLTVDQISEILNMGEATVKRAIKELESVTYEGKHILLKSQVGKGRRQRNTYTILENPLVSLFGEDSLGVKMIPNEDSLSIKMIPKQEPLGVKMIPENDSLGIKLIPSKENKITKEKDIKEYEEEPSMKVTKNIENKPMGKKAVVDYFKGLLLDKGIDSKFTYQQVYSVMKKQGVDPLLKEMKNNEIKRTLEVIAEEYESWNSNSQYPLSVKVVGWKWVWERAMKETQKEKESVSQIEEQSVVADRRQNDSINRLKDLIKKKGGQQND